MIHQIFEHVLIPSVIHLQPKSIQSARYGEVDDIRLAMANGCDLNFASEGGSNTALHMSSANGHLECVKVLVDAGALLLPNSTGNTPLRKS
jgi:ankyrin repeat protein